MGTYNIAVIKGDGIGPEVTGAAQDVLVKVGERFSHKFNFTESICGGAAYDRYGEPLPEESLEICLKSDSVLLGAVGGPQYDSLPYEKRPERALLGVRKAMGLYANLRPARLFPALEKVCPLKNPGKIDLLVVREIGKNISGSGMDPNITGTWSTPYGGGGLKKQRVTVLDLTDESKGNALGIGRADTTTMRVFDKIDFTQLYPNLLTSTVVSPGMIPMVLEDDKMAITAAIKMLTGVDKDNVRVVMIKNTLSLSEIYLSEALLPQAEADGRMEVLEEPHPMEFGTDGRLIAW